MQESKLVSEEGLPETYDRKDKNVALQIDAYRNSFNDIMKHSDDKMTLPLQHIPGLFPIIKEGGFALVHVYMNKWGNAEDYIPLVKRLWRITQQINQKEWLSGAIFQEINIILADIVQGYNAGSTEKITLIARKLESLESHLLKSTTTGEFAKRVIGKAMELPSTGGQYKRPVFVIYAHPNPDVKIRGIGEKTFVEQYCHPDYPGYIAVFDVLSEPKALKPEGILEKGPHEYKTKKDPHYSMENGTATMLNHDYAHINGTVFAEEFLNKLNFNLHDYLKKIYQLKNEFDINTKSDENNASILINGIFMLFHELALELPGIVKQIDYSHVRTQDEFAALLIEGVRDWMGKFRDYAQEYKEMIPGNVPYKEELRDWERILEKSQDLDGNPFVISKSRVTRRGNIKANIGELADSYVRFWNAFLSIVKPPELTTTNPKILEQGN